MKKIVLFLKFCLSSVGSFLLDIAVFTIASSLLQNVVPSDAIFSDIILATIIARVCSGVFNFTINQLIFGGKRRSGSGLKYLLVWLVQMALSAKIVDYFVTLLPFIHRTIVKMMVDSCLFVISFFVQKKWVFASKDEKTRTEEMFEEETN